jgi:hypothetical protein
VSERINDTPLALAYLSTHEDFLGSDPEMGTGSHREARARFIVMGYVCIRDMDPRNLAIQNPVTGPA